MASVPLSASSQAGLLLLPLPLLQPPGAGACLRYRLPRLPPALSSVRKGGLLPLPLPILALPRATEGKDGRAVTKEEVEEEDEEEVEVRKEGGEDGGSGDGGGAREDESRGSGRFAADYISLGIKEPVYEVGGQ
ncbi:hypothetical protein C2845_PM01G32460 [Panicum miliaceum]|uniref:Uncharacterized protein n=1 Tax=Panicum miliaceum TaxID=4540 RepID=A0A3L6TG64_PANMI|nr:hypothetical protein C2845_PM01G32460 [Panicum miliaceum]